MHAGQVEGESETLVVVVLYLGEYRAQSVACGEWCHCSHLPLSTQLIILTKHTLEALIPVQILPRFIMIAQHQLTQSNVIFDLFVSEYPVLEQLFILFL